MAAAAPGDLDTTFGVGGISLTTFGTGTDKAVAMAIQPDGKYVVAGTREVVVGGSGTTVFLTLARFTTDGALDATFGTGGKVQSDVFNNAACSDVVVLTDGRIAVTSRGGCQVACFLADGRPDTSFGTAGLARVTASSWSSGPGPYYLAARPNGGLLLAGTVWTTRKNDFAIFCLSPNGAEDLTFGNEGHAIIDVAGGSDDMLYSLAVRRDNRILLGGTCQSNDAALVSLAQNGTLDTSFGSGGIVVTSGTALSPVTDLVERSDGGLLALVANGPVSSVRCYTQSGAVDGAYGGGGKVDLQALFPQQGQVFVSPTAAVAQTDGSLILVGTKNNGYPTYKDIWLSRLGPTGTLDTGFGQNGQAVTDLGGADDCAAAGIGPDGKLAVAGYALVSAVLRSVPAVPAITRASQTGGMGLARYDCSKSSITPTPTPSKAKPVLVKLSPAKGSIGTVVVITGRYFGSKRGSSCVRFGAKKVTKYVKWSATKIKVKVPKGTRKGAVKVTVKTSAGTSGAKTFKRK
jgi:uncharacterized delta-60 repeat protein